MSTPTPNRHPEVDALREGRHTRAATFRPLKGKGSYRRAEKHRG